MGQPDQWGPAQFNFNGLLCSGNRHSLNSGSYVQLFRSGAIEAVCHIRAHDQDLGGMTFELPLTKEAPAYIEFQNRLGLGPPLFVAVSLISVKGFRILPTLTPQPFGWLSICPIDQDVLLGPEALLEEEGLDFGRVLRPALDAIWQASGWPESQCYDENGGWIGYSK